MITVAGIDGGGTQTRAVIMTESGQVCGLGKSGPSNLLSTGANTTKKNIALALKRAWAGTPKRPLDAIFLGMAGVATEPERDTIRKIVVAVTKSAHVQQIQVDHDMRIALAGGLCGSAGVILIAGTGSACYGRTESGQSFRAGGWGHLLDDAGSGYALGLQAIIAAAKADDGRGPQTALTPMIYEALAKSNLREVLHALYGRGVKALSREKIAALAPRVIAVAEDGDLAAREIVDRGIRELVLLMTTVAGKLPFEVPPRVTFAGGLAVSAGPYGMKLRAALTAAWPECELVEPELPPVAGAGILALKAAGVDISADVRKRIKTAHNF